MSRFRAIVFILAATLLAGCATIDRAPTREIHHVVLCWLKEPGNAAHRRKIITASETFRKIPGVKSLYAGQALPSNRHIVDDSFDVAISMTFANEVDMMKYLDHPTHIKAVDEIIQPLVGKIAVYDFR